MLTDRELQSLRNMGNEAETAAAEIERLRAALTLAANRMDVLALDHDYGTTRRNIADDWARETRAALAPNTANEPPAGSASITELG